MHAKFYNGQWYNDLQVTRVTRLRKNKLQIATSSEYRGKGNAEQKTVRCVKTVIRTVYPSEIDLCYGVSNGIMIQGSSYFYRTERSAEK